MMDIGDFGMRADSLIASVADPGQTGLELTERLTEVRGHGEAADGRVRAVANGRGEIIELAIDPRLFRRSSDDVSTLAREAVNAALADARQRDDAQIAGAVGPLADLTQRINQDFSTMLSKVRSDVEQARRRMTDASGRRGSR